MSRPAPPIARHVAMLVVLLGAVPILLAMTLVRSSAPAEASVLMYQETTEPSPSPTSPSPTPSLPGAQVALAPAACDALRLSAQADRGVALSYRVADEAGNAAASGSFTGSINTVLALSTGHEYTASVSDPSSGVTLASAGPVSLRNACPVSVTADPPGFTDPCGTDRDAVVVPRIIGVDYRVAGTVLVPGANAATGTVTVEAAAQPGYSLNGPTRWTHTFTADPCLAAPEPPVRPRAPSPSLTDPVSPAAPSVAPLEQPTQSAPAPPLAQRTAAPQPDAPSVHRDDEPAVQASVGGPGPLAWGIMIAVAVAGGIVFWFKTRH